MLAILATLLMSAQATKISGIGMLRYMEGAPSARRHPPPLHHPQPRRPPPQRSPPASDGKALQTVITPPQLQLLCPQIIDVFTGFPKDDPDCVLPRVVLAEGAMAAEMQTEIGMTSGDIVNVTLDVAANGSLSLSSFKTLARGSQKGCKCIYADKPIDDRLVLYLLDFSSCPGAGMAPPAALTPEAARRLLSAGGGLQAYQETCSYYKRYLNPDNTAVVGPVPVPCTGALSHPQPRTDLVGLSGAAANALRMNSTHTGWWDLSRTCTPAEMGAIERAAEAFAQQLIATNPDDPEARKLLAILTWKERRRSIFVLPPGSACAKAWPAMAESICTVSTCSIFVDASTLLPPVSAAAAAPPRPPHVLMHELLHVQGLSHAAYGALEAGDPTDVMGTFGGAGTGLLCPNAPNMYRIGWAKPINPPGTPPFIIETSGAWGNLTAKNFTTDSWIRGLIIPAQGTRDDNMIVVNVGAEDNSSGVKKAAGAQSYYFSYRVRNNTANGYDSGLSGDYNKKVLVHNYNGIQSERVFGFKSNLLDWGPSFQRTGNAWISPFLALDANGLGGGVRLEVKSTTETQAVVDICRITENGKEQTCSDGLDNDCDGQLDDGDPDCA
ncbi:hypothetical protein HYH02_005390 [Chlamydomonas schloesseri]|uniref:Peptidase M11 gametolysin domain-containing protein n=1 Tax=Chlamydomonas schloesseri TaxID=2026947 RepID=A0A835WM30_9CHLO|nr:hypothetical protein HYH02_005390 [Chlamydomonas schloesseri]|eukprot:KAG2449867.1 hypothetical protein HYH02_005390 [Chlamydomonas schloesseri]